MRRSDEGGAGSWRRTQARAHVEALRVDGDRTKRDAGRRQRPARHRVAGILDPDLVARRKQHPYRNVDRMLGARGDDDLLRARAHAARGAEIIADGAAQLRQSARVRIAAVDRIEAAKHLLGEPAPDLDGARVDEHARIGERAVFVFDGDGAEHGEGARLRRKRRRRARGLASPRPQPLDRFRQVGADVGAGADAAGQIAFGEKLLISGNDRSAGDAELGRERPRRGQLCSRGQPLPEDGAAHLQIDLAEDRRGRCALDLPGVERRPSGSGADARGALAGSGLSHRGKVDFG